MFGEMLPGQTVQDRRADRLGSVELLDDFPDDLLNGVEVRLRLQRVGDTVELVARERGVVVLGIVFVMLEADRGDEPMRH